MMKRIFALLLTGIMCLSLCGCKSKKVQECEEFISNIGTFVVSDENATEEEFEKAKEANAATVKSIEDAQKAYDLLTEKEKSKVENYAALEDAAKALYEWRREGAKRITLVSVISLDAAAEATDQNVRLISKTWNWFEREWDFPVWSCTWEDPWDNSWITAHGLELAWTIGSDGGAVISAMKDQNVTHEDMHNLNKIFEFVRYLQEDSYQASESLVSDVKSYLKIMEENCGEAGQDYRDALNAYYVAVEEYLRLATEPGEAKTEFTDRVQNCQDKIAACQNELNDLCS